MGYIGVSIENIFCEPMEEMCFARCSCNRQSWPCERGDILVVVFFSIIYLEFCSVCVVVIFYARTLSAEGVIKNTQEIKKNAS